MSKPRYEFIRTSIQQPLDHNVAGGDTLHERVDIIIPEGADPSSPVFFELGMEHDIDGWLLRLYKAYDMPRNVIFMMAEHRGYGKSVSRDADQSVPTYVRISQALADYHNVFEQLKAKYTGPWMAVGHSYGGGLVINFASSYPDDVKVILCSSGVVDWPFIMDAYDRQVRITMGDNTYQRLASHIKNLEPGEMFDRIWLEREFLTAFIHGTTQYGEFKFMLPLFKALASLPTSGFLGALHFMDVTFAKKGAIKYALSNAKKTLTRDESMSGDYQLRVWRYQQCVETGIFEVSARPGGVFPRGKDDFFAESKALFGDVPQSASNPPWSPRAMLDKLSVPLVYIGGGMDPWMGLGITPEYVIKDGKYFYEPEGQHCPDMNDRKLSRQVLDYMLRLASGPSR